MHLFRVAVKILFATWVTGYALMMGLGAWLNSGPTDFNGEPISAVRQLGSYGIMAIAIIQIGLLGQMAQKPHLAGRLVCLIALGGSLPWIGHAIVEQSFSLNDFALPAAYVVGLGVMYSAHYLATPISERSNNR